MTYIFHCLIWLCFFNLSERVNMWQTVCGGFWDIFAQTWTFYYTCTLYNAKKMVVSCLYCKTYKNILSCICNYFLLILKNVFATAQPSHNNVTVKQFVITGLRLKPISTVHIQLAYICSEVSLTKNRKHILKWSSVWTRRAKYNLCLLWTLL